MALTIKKKAITIVKSEVTENGYETLIKSNEWHKHTYIYII